MNFGEFVDDINRLTHQYPESRDWEMDDGGLDFRKIDVGIRLSQNFKSVSITIRRIH